MRFYIIRTTSDEEVIGCQTTLAAAKAYCERRAYSHKEVEIDPIDVPVTAESIRRLLGNHGGFSL